MVPACVSQARFAGSSLGSWKVQQLRRGSNFVWLASLSGFCEPGCLFRQLGLRSSQKSYTLQASVQVGRVAGSFSHFGNAAFLLDLPTTACVLIVLSLLEQCHQDLSSEPCPVVTHFYCSRGTCRAPSIRQRVRTRLQAFCTLVRQGFSEVVPGCFAFSLGFPRHTAADSLPENAIQQRHEETIS